MRQEVSRTISGVGSGPLVGDLIEFLANVPDYARLDISKIPRDRPFDPEGWRVTLRYTEE